MKGGHDLNPIWLVEDSENDIELTLAALEECQLADRVVTMRDGSDALDRIETLNSTADNLSPSVVLMDIKMPKVSGIEVLHRIKSDPDLKHIPVVMLSSSAQDSDVTECYEVGANAYIVKPLESEDFFRALRVAGEFWAVVNHKR